MRKYHILLGVVPYYSGDVVGIRMRCSGKEYINCCSLGSIGDKQKWIWWYLVEIMRYIYNYVYIYIYIYIYRILDIYIYIILEDLDVLGIHMCIYIYTRILGICL